MLKLKVLQMDPCEVEVVRLAWERHQRGWSQAELARQAHIARTDINRAEVGNLKLSNRQLVKLAEALSYGGDPACLLETVVLIEQAPKRSSQASLRSDPPDPGAPPAAAGPG